jgi:hypothetical protein
MSGSFSHQADLANWEFRRHRDAKQVSHITHVTVTQAFMPSEEERLI